MKPTLSLNDQVRVLQGGDTLYFIAGINANNMRLVDICVEGGSQILTNISTDILILDKHYLLKKISAIHEIKKGMILSPETAIQSNEKFSEFNTECETESPTKLMEINLTLIEWQNSTPSISDSELANFIKQYH